MKNYYDWIRDNSQDILRGNGRSLYDTWLTRSHDMKEKLSKNTQYIMLLTTDEAQALIDKLYNKGTTYAGNIKDSISGVNNISKLITYRDAGKLVFNLKGLGINAVTYMYKGVPYIKITGYPSLRRVLRGTTLRSE